MTLALVTGAGVRVGRAIALRLADAGYDLVLAAHHSSLDETARAARDKGRQVHTVVADLATDAGVAAVADAAGGVVDLLVNAAGAIAVVPFAAVTRAQFRELSAVNVEAAFFLTQALLPALRASTAPSVVNITDAALQRPYDAQQTLSHYVASKGALTHLTYALARELAPHIRVNAVAPGPVAFGAHDDPAHRERVLTRLPLGREGAPDDVAQAVLYLASAPYVTGQILHADGGLTVG